MNANDLLILADANYAQSIVVSTLWSPEGEVVVRNDLQLVASATRFPAGSFNCIMPIGEPADARRAESWLHDAATFFGARNRGFSVLLRGEKDHVLDRACMSFGMEKLGTPPGMVLENRVAPATIPGNVEIVRVSSSRQLADFVDVAAVGFTQIKLPEDISRGLFIHHDRILSPYVHFYVAYLDGRPAATTMAVDSHGISGIYWVATHPDMQRRGLADAIMRFASNAAFDRGAPCVILQASPFGEPVYRRMGYREFTRYPSYFIRRSTLESRSQGK